MSNPDFVKDPEKIQISQYDQRCIHDLALETIYAIQEDGSHSRPAFWNLDQVFRMGFPAVGRGEAEGQQHPPAQAVNEGEPNDVKLGEPGGVKGPSKGGQIVETAPACGRPDAKKCPTW
jgi:hypothetical protein